MQKQKILFTGSLGFLFSNFIRKVAYEKHPYSFCGIDKAVDKKYLNNFYHNKIIENNYLADVCDHHIINNIFDIEKPEIIIHAASFSENSENISNVKSCIDTNILGTKVIVDAAKRHNVKKIIHFSDYRVYQESFGDSLIKENNTLKNDSILNISKIAAENIIISSGLNYNVLRISNIYGPRQSNDQIIPSIIKSIYNGEKLSLNYNGMQTLDWMHAFDFSSAMITLLKEGHDNEIYNIGSGQDCSLIEIIQFICNIMNKGHNLISCHGKMNDSKYLLDNQKIIKLGWKPMFRLKKGLEETVEWFLANQWALK